MQCHVWAPAARCTSSGAPFRSATVAREASSQMSWSPVAVKSPVCCNAHRMCQSGPLHLLVAAAPYLPLVPAGKRRRRRPVKPVHQTTGKTMVKTTSRQCRSIAHSAQHCIPLSAKGDIACEPSSRLPALVLDCLHIIDPVGRERNGIDGKRGLNKLHGGMGKGEEQNGESGGTLSDSERF